MFYFSAHWCGPCRAFAPVYDEASLKHPDVTFGKVDTEAEQALAQAANIRSIPTLMAFRDGILVFAQPGALPAPALEEVITAVKALDMNDVRAELARRDGQRTPAWFIFQDDRRAVSVFRLCDSVWVRREELPVDTVLNRARGIVDENLYTDIEQAGAPSALAVMLANVYAYTIDFTRLQEGDQFDVLYEREYVNGEPVGNPRILACHFIHKGKDRPAYVFEGSSGRGYYDGDGNSMKRAFLKSPVEFSRISSRFNKKRFHPVLHRVKAHLGTDYSAPHGTPILAVGDGVVTHSAYTSGNGNYVKIRHNGTYETQYLHMSRQAVRKGERVTQGQVIGYVGSTGLSTGPHVCFRFWKNGVQVDHLAEDIPSAGPVAAADRASFEAFRDRCARLLGPTGEEDCATSE
jgi:murein DD-endopeptidase MepM/ murein hydrolase activator NlpD